MRPRAERRDRFLPTWRRYRPGSGSQRGTRLAGSRQPRGHGRPVSPSRAPCPSLEMMERGWGGGGYPVGVAEAEPQSGLELGNAPVTWDRVARKPPKPTGPLRTCRVFWNDRAGGRGSTVVCTSRSPRCPQGSSFPVLHPSVPVTRRPSPKKSRKRNHKNSILMIQK